MPCLSSSTSVSSTYYAYPLNLNPFSGGDSSEPGRVSQRGSYPSQLDPFSEDRAGEDYPPERNPFLADNLNTVECAPGSGSRRWQNLARASDGQRPPKSATGSIGGAFCHGFSGALLAITGGASAGVAGIIPHVEWGFNANEQVAPMIGSATGTVAGGIFGALAAAQFLRALTSVTRSETRSCVPLYLGAIVGSACGAMITIGSTLAIDHYVPAGAFVFDQPANITGADTGVGIGVGNHTYSTGV
ncbi:hypothetical protein [Pararobbsia alpina]|uniref:hypothetical protein n=1 Tax=Pararobbsia alpina TaxID=621374 RepID=UPI0039A44007